MTGKWPEIIFVDENGHPDIRAYVYVHVYIFIINEYNK